MKGELSEVQLEYIITVGLNYLLSMGAMSLNQEDEEEEGELSLDDLDFPDIDSGEVH